MLFQYARLAQNSIRLVEFHPSSSSSDMRLTLSHQDRYFDKSTRYTAIWYPSESPDAARKTVTLNGRTRTVPANAWDALSTVLECCGRDHKYWIDAVCINQADEAEKKMHQEQIRSIFCSAEKSYLWLGPSDDAVDLAFSAARKHSEAEPSIVAAVSSAASRQSFVEALSKPELQVGTAILLSGKLDCRLSLFEEYRNEILTSHGSSQSGRQSQGSL